MEIVQVVGSVLALAAILWVAALAYSVVHSRKKAWAHAEELQRAGFSIDHVLKGNIYVLFDQARKKIAFVFSDKSSVHNYSDVQHVTRYWLGFSVIKLRNSMVFTLDGKRIRCGNLSARQAEYWQSRVVELIRAQ